MNFSYNKLVIIFLVISVFLISYAIWKSVSLDNKQANPDVPTSCTGTDCKVDCGVLSPLTIKECKNTEEGKKICSNCKCDASGRFSGCMECKESDPSNPSLTYSIQVGSEDDCTEPFQWNKDAQICTLRKGFFCLPPNINPIDCNPYTGRQLLTFDPTNNVYGWTCVCKNSTKFSGSICNQINVCGMEGSVQNPDNSNTGRGLISKTNKDDYWNYKKSTWDPLAMDSDGNYINSACSCLGTEFADNKNLLCLPNGCYPGSISSVSPDNCDCTCKGCTGLVDCKTISSSYDPQMGVTYYNSVCKIPSCVPDPCGGIDGTHGKYTVTTDKSGVATGNCVCNTEAGYYLVPDPAYYGGFRCAKLCQDDSICGNRGKCVVKSLDDSYTIFTIVCKDQDPTTGQCGGSGLFFIKYSVNDNIYYLNYNKDNKTLSLDLTQNPDSYFSFKIRSCDSKYTDGTCKYTVSDKIITTGLISGNYYYMMIGDKYLIFKSDFTFDLVNDSDDGKAKEGSLFLFSSSIGNKRPYPKADGTIFFDLIQNYLSASSTTPPSLFYESSSKTPEQCEPCNTGWKQDPKDPDQRCKKSCGPSGYTYTNEQNVFNISDLCCNGGTVSQTTERSCPGGRGSCYDKINYTLLCN